MILSSPSAPLPVELVSFTADCSNGHELLNWSTASETNNDYFLVERSDDGNTFYEIGRAAGHGTSSQTNNYTFTDPQPLSGTVYYRLEQIDYNGKTEELPII